MDHVIAHIAGTPLYESVLPQLLIHHKVCAVDLRVRRRNIASFQQLDVVLPAVPFDVRAPNQIARRLKRLDKSPVSLQMSHQVMAASSRLMCVV